MALHITGDSAADELLSSDAFALLTGGGWFALLDSPARE